MCSRLSVSVCVCGCSYRRSSAPVEPGHMTAAAHVQSFLFPGHSSCISQLLAFHKAKARMDPPAKSHRRTESVWGGWEPTGMQRWLRMQCTAIYIYIYIYRIYTKQQRDPNETPDISFYTNTERRRTNFFFFLNKKKYFCFFSL